MKAEFLKPDGLNDIPSMQQYLIEQSANKQWECIQKALEQYLGEPLTEDHARHVEVQYQDDITRLLYENRIIGIITMRQEGDFGSNCIKFVWTYEPHAISTEGMCRVNERREQNNIPLLKSLYAYHKWRDSEIQYDN